jgi:glycosyltransferase involved in cell wall biosynthesis
VARLVCLLPARNAAPDLPGCFASLRRFCDAIVALDDGSTDETKAVLAAEPLVEILLENPLRPDYRGWDDAANRNCLLEAAGALRPEWIISVDADERLDAGDAAALLDFLDGDALPGCVYGFRHVPMRADEEHFVPRYQWVYRLFAYTPGQRFPDDRLHFAPVPTAIPRARWFRTTLRIQHLGGMTEGRRLARFAKYLEADPDRTYQADYTNLLRTPAESELRLWVVRPPGLPVLLGAAGPDPAADAEVRDLIDLADEGQPDTPALSAIVITRNNEGTIARTVASVVDQECPEPFEVIVVTSGTDRTAEIVRERFPSVTVVELPRPALPGEARNAGLRVARGTFVSFPGSHVELPPGSLAARLAAHRRGYAMVTGVTLNGTATRAGWASYFLDHHEGLPGHRPAELNGPPAHCSYARLPLLEVGGFPEGVRTGEDTAVNRALVHRGYVALRDPAIQFVHRSPCRTPLKLIRHHFARGRGWGRLVVEEHRERGHLIGRELLLARLVRHVPDRVGRIRRNVEVALPEYRGHYRRSLPLIWLGATASWAGMWVEILRPAPGKWAILVGQPIRTLLVVADGPAEPTILLLRLDAVGRRVQVLGLPAELSVSSANGTHSLTEALNSASRTEQGPRDAGATLERLRDVVRRAVNLAADDFLIGPSEAVAQLLGARLVVASEEPSSQDGDDATTFGTSGPRIAAAVLRGAVRSSLGRIGLLKLAFDVRRWAVDRGADVQAVVDDDRSGAGGDPDQGQPRRTSPGGPRRPAAIKRPTAPDPWLP